MHDKRNPYRAYTIPAAVWQEESRRREAERQRQADAAHRTMLSSLSSPAAVYKPAPSPKPVSASWVGRENRLSFPSRAPAKRQKAFPWPALWWLLGLIVVANILAAS